MNTLHACLLSGAALLVLQSTQLAPVRRNQVTPLRLSTAELQHIYGGSNEGPGCRVLIDKTTCEFNQPPGTGTHYVCHHIRDAAGNPVPDPNYAANVQGYRAACVPAQYNSGVGDLETAGAPIFPNSNELGPNEVFDCFRNYDRDFIEQETFKLECPGGIPPNVTKCICRDTIGPVTQQVLRQKCLDP